MIDLGLDKLALIGAVALIVIGPERLPKVARTVGHLVGKAQRYVADVKAEVNRSMALEELQKMKTQVEDEARQAQKVFHEKVGEFHQQFSDIPVGPGVGDETEDASAYFPAYQAPRKNWRIKRGAMPLWFKRQNGIRTHAQSGAARVARFRPRRPLRS